MKTLLDYMGVPHIKKTNKQDLYFIGRNHLSIDLHRVLELFDIDCALTFFTRLSQFLIFDHSYNFVPSHLQSA